MGFVLAAVNVKLSDFKYAKPLIATETNFIVVPIEFISAVFEEYSAQMPTNQ